MEMKQPEPQSKQNPSDCVTNWKHHSQSHTGWREKRKQTVFVVEPHSPSRVSMLPKMDPSCSFRMPAVWKELTSVFGALGPSHRRLGTRRLSCPAPGLSLFGCCDSTPQAGRPVNNRVDPSQCWGLGHLRPRGWRAWCPREPAFWFVDGCPRPASSRGRRTPCGVAFARPRVPSMRAPPS